MIPLYFCCLLGEGRRRRDWLRASSFRRVQSSTTAAVCTPSYFRAERRPLEDFLLALCWQEGRQHSSSSTSASSSSAWCLRRRCGGVLAPSGCVPGGEVAGFELWLYVGLDRVFKFYVRVLFAKSKDQPVIFFILCSLDVIESVVIVLNIM